MADIIKRGISNDYHLRYFFVETEKVAEMGREIHSLTTPIETVLFTKMLMAGLMFGADLKDDNFAVTLKTNFNNEENYVLVTSNRRGEVKGYPFFPDQLKTTHFETNKAIQDELKKHLQGGLFTVIKDIGMKTPYNGTTQLITGELARDITYYFTTSEQTPSAVGLSVVLNEDGSVRKGVGFIVQLLPEANTHTLEHLESNLKSLPEVTDLLDMGMTIDDIMSKLVLKGFECQTIEESQVKYSCNCSKDRFERGLRLLGESELEMIIAESDEPLVVQCQYCLKQYTFTIEEIETMINELKRGKGVEE